MTITYMGRLAFAAVALAASIPAPLAAQGTDAVVDRAVAAWNRVTSLRASFEQTVTNPLTGGAETARGEYQQQGRGRMSVRFTDPKGDRIVADGKSLWLFLPSTTPGQVIQTSPREGSVDFAAQFLASPKTRYVITDGGRATVDGRAAQVLSLTPKSGSGAGFARARVWVDDRDDLIRQFEVVDQSGLTRRVRLTSLRVNAPVDAREFRFSVPKGVRVVKQ